MHFQGTKVEILKPRKLDDSTAGFEKWKFMSVASWGEDPRGSWILDIFDEVIHSRINFPFNFLYRLFHVGEKNRMPI